MQLMNKQLNKIILLLSIVTLSVSCKSHRNELKIDLKDKKLTEIPNSVFENKNLTDLDLGSNEIVFYPPLSVQLDKNQNKISELPERISELTQLKKLILNSNKLTTLPYSIIKLENLEVLDLALNKDLNIINEIPKLNKLPKLRVLIITDTKLNSSDLNLIQETLNKNIKLIYTVEEYFDYLENDTN